MNATIISAIGALVFVLVFTLPAFVATVKGIRKDLHERDAAKESYQMPGDQ